MSNPDFDLFYSQPLEAGKATDNIPVIGGAVKILVDAATIVVNAALGNHFRVTIVGNRTLGNPTNAIDGQSFFFEIIQGAGGTHTLTLDTKFNLGLLTPALSTVAGKRDYFWVQYNATADKFDVLYFAAGY
jgi:hypothetical protein